MSEDAEATASRAPRITSTTRLAVTVGFGVSGAAALIYEIAWTRELSLVFSSTVYAVSLMLAAFMCGLSLGGFLGGRVADRDRDHLRDLAMVELGIGLFGLLSLLHIRALPWLQFQLFQALEPAPAVFFAMQMLLAFLVMLVPTTLMGATFPLASKTTIGSYGHLGRSVGNLYSANNLGAVGGSLLAGFMLIPFVGVRATVAVAAVLNILVAVLLLVLAGRRPGSAHVIAGVVAIGLLSASLLLPEPALTLGFGLLVRFDTYQEFKHGLLGVNKVVWSDENAYSRVAVLENTETGERSLVNGSMIEGSDEFPDRVTTSLLALLPAEYAENPRSALVVGLGTSMTSQAALSLPFDSVTTVEINPSVPKAAKYFGMDKAEDDPRWRLEVADARQHLAVHTQRYDLITSEPSWPLASSVSPLFTLEFFDLARSRLNEGGVFCQWLPQYLLPREDFAMMYKTFSSAFPNAEVWQVEIDGKPNGDIFLVGVKGAEHPDAETIREQAQAQLDARGLGSARIKPFAARGLLEESLTSRDVPLNTDDRPVLEYHVPWRLVSHSLQ